ncbi:hypothetical protein PG1791B_1308 [Bifidobacterium pseudolongum subsp. globosum]|nr:hypothetical protein PG1791B_1308 [Bifidobacterium pseudolongum subsp. globosum]
MRRDMDLIRRILIMVGDSPVRLPRMRGDDPTWFSLQVTKKAFAPHARG